jgi:hypothetical protein
MGAATLKLFTVSFGPEPGTVYRAILVAFYDREQHTRAGASLKPRSAKRVTTSTWRRLLHPHSESNGALNHFPQLLVYAVYILAACVTVAVVAYALVVATTTVKYIPGVVVLGVEVVVTVAAIEVVEVTLVVGSSVV